MSDKTSTLKKPIKNGKKFFLLYSAAFLVCAALCYFWFIINKKTLIINSDGWRQHFAAFVYFGKYGREILETLFETHKFVLPQWVFYLCFVYILRGLASVHSVLLKSKITFQA